MDDIFVVSPKSGSNYPDIIIKTEADAYYVLELAAKGKLPSYNRLIFEGWPSLNLYLKGEKFDQSITPTIMKGLLELQKGIYRSYAVASSGNASKRLTEQEKEDLEITVDVKDGSSNFDIDFTKVATKFIDMIGDKMDPTQIILLVLPVFLMYFGHSAYRTYLENRKEIKIREIGDETQRKMLEQMQFASEQETKRAQIMADIVKREPRVAEVERIAEDAHAGLIKSLGAGDKARVGGVPLTPEVVETLTQGARRKSHEVRLDGLYQVLKLDWSDPLRFRVKAYSKKTGIIIDADVQDGSLEGRHKEAIKEAEWSRKLVDLRINAKTPGDGTYKDAVIISAVIPEED